MNTWTKPGRAYNQRLRMKGRGLSFLIYPFYFVLLLWLVFWVNQRFSLGLEQLGIYPQKASGLIGIVMSPLLHGSLSHLASNSLPLLVLGSVLNYFYPKKALSVWVISWVLSGLLVWVWGRPSHHIGASSVVYALAAFVFLSGLLRSHRNLLAISLLVVFLYGGLVWGVLPVEESVSYEGHLFGGISGLLLAILYRNVEPWGAEPIMEMEIDEESEIEELEGVFGKNYWMQDHSHNQHSITVNYFISKKESSEGQEKP